MMGMSGYLVILLTGGVMVGAMMLTSSLVNIKTAFAGVKRVNETMRIEAEE